jgi:hypothetical protein
MNGIRPILGATQLADPWQAILAFALVANGIALASYRYYRFVKGGPRADAAGGTVLGALLILTAVLVLNDVSWARWVALGYGLVFAVVVMPIWTLAVLIPLPPEPLDYAFTAFYEASLLTIVVASIAA